MNPIETRKKPLVLWGGTDINPLLYNQIPHPHTQRPDLVRDERELRMFETARENDWPIVGVCRGAQLLCVLNGGSLWQHTVPTTQCHDIKTKDGVIYKTVEAEHHQIMVPAGDFEILGTSCAPTKVYDHDMKMTVHYDTPEVIWYPKSKCLAIQPHPEWAPGSDFTLWINDLMKSFDINYSF